MQYREGKGKTLVTATGFVVGRSENVHVLTNIETNSYHEKKSMYVKVFILALL